MRPRRGRYTDPMLAPDSGPVPTLRVALPVPLPRLFDYLPPQGEGPTVAVGCRLKVPFGNRELIGVVAGHGQAEDSQGLRQALAWCDTSPLLQGELWQSLQWLARYTHAPLGEVLSTALPGPLRHGEPLPDTHHWGWQLTPEAMPSAKSCAPAADHGNWPSCWPTRWWTRMSCPRACRTGGWPHAAWASATWPSASP